MAYVEVEITTNEQTIREEGIAKLKELLEAKGLVGWEANEADLSVIQIATDASMVPIVAQIAAVVPPAIFRKFGTELIKVLYNEGAAATVTTKWTLVEEGGEYPAHTIEVGTQLSIGELAFLVQANTSVAKGESTKNVVLVAAERGTEFNNLTGTVQLVNALSYVKEVTIIGETSGGVNQETDEEYENRLQAALKLQAPRPVTAANFAEMALQVPSSIVPTGVVVGRTTAIDGYNPATNEPEAKVTSGSTEINEITSETGLTVNTEVVGTGVPAGTLLVSKTKAGEWKMSAKATSSPAKGKYQFIGSYENQRTVTTFVTDKKGKALTTEAMESIEDWLEEFREINFLPPVRAAKYSEVRVTTQVHVLPGYTAASVEANVKTAIEKFLNPETFGNPTGQTTGANSWLNIIQGYSIVRYNTILGVIEAVPGVQYVFTGSTGLAMGLEEAPGAKVADIVLPGPAPLPETKAAEVKVTSA
jgi:fructose-specific component phosphotransferase system IIB-like protein/predicted HicB family RNase H-like nuclease